MLSLIVDINILQSYLNDEEEDAYNCHAFPHVSTYIRMRVGQGYCLKRLFRSHQSSRTS